LPGCASIQNSFLGQTVRASGSFNIQTSQGVVQGIAYRHCSIMQRNDGYGYSIRGI
jgi:hypothetical protein